LLDDTIAGTDLYYASLYYPRHIRESLCALEVTRRAIASILQRKIDPGVANIKLSWWWDEVERYRSNKPRHPALRQLKEYGPSSETIGVGLHTLVENVQTQISQQATINRQTRLEDIQFINESIFRYMAELSADRQGSYDLVLKIAYLNEMANQLLSSLSEPQSTRLLANAVTSALLDLSSTLSICSRALRRRQTFFFTLALINRRVLEITNENLVHNRNRTELLPITKLWISWRTSFWG
jgi:hypothetical protein